MPHKDIIEGKPFQMPDELTVVAIGGAGKKLLSNLYDHEWFLKHYLTDGKRLSLYTIDTDTNQRKDDIRRSDEVTARLGDIQRTNSQMGEASKASITTSPTLQMSSVSLP